MRLAKLFVFLLLLCGCAGAGQGSLPSGLPGQAMLPALGDLPRAASTSGQGLSGSEYASALPAARETVDGSDLLLSGGADLSEMAYAIYAFSLDGFSGPADIAVDFGAAPEDCWIAWSDYSRSRWAFAPAGSELTTVNAGDSAELFSGDGSFYVAVIVAAERQERVESVTVGTPLDDNIAPVAVLALDSIVIPPASVINYDSTGSYDPDGSIVLWELDMDGDGVYESSHTSAPADEASFTVEGRYNLHLRVTDDDGGVDVATVGLTVGGSLQWFPNNTDYPFPDELYGHVIFAAGGSPLVLHTDTDGALYSTRASDELGEVWPDEPSLLDGSGLYSNGKLAMIAGKPAMLYMMDMDPGIGRDMELHYISALNSAGTEWSEPVVIPVEGLLERVYGLLEVDGRPGILYEAYIHEESAFFGYYSRALDAEGRSWGEQIRASELDIVDGLVSDLFLLEGRPAWVAIDYTGAEGYLKLCRAEDSLGAQWASVQDIATIETNSVALPCAAVIGDRLSIFYADYESIQVIRASNAEATVWGSPMDIAPCAFASGIILTDCFGHPAIAWADLQPYTKSTVFFSRALDAEGSSWPAEAMVVTEVVGEVSSYSHNLMGIGSLGGYPAALTSRVLGTPDPAKFSRLY